MNTRRRRLAKRRRAHAQRAHDFRVRLDRDPIIGAVRGMMRQFLHQVRQLDTPLLRWQYAVVRMGDLPGFDWYFDPDRLVVAAPPHVEEP